MVGGLVGGSQSCCCETPPPPACYCGSFCSNVVEIVSPSQLAGKSHLYSCDGTRPAPRTTASWIFGESVFPEEWSTECDDPRYYCQGQSGKGGNNPVINSRLPEHSIKFEGCLCRLNRGWQQVLISAYYRIEFSCDLWGDPFLRASVWVHANDNFVAAYPDVFFNTLAYTAQAYREVSIYPESFCQYNLRRECSLLNFFWHPGDGVRYARTPIELTFLQGGVSVDGVLYAYTESTDVFFDADVSPPIRYDSFEGRANPSAVLVKNILNTFNPTFRITSRQSCREVPADCDVPIGNGDMTVAIATNPALPVGDPQNDRFILGTATVHQGSGPNNTTIRTEHFGAAAGDSGDPYLFLYQVKNQAGNILQEQYIELFCATDNAVSPPVSRWYVSIETLCYPNPGYGWTIDEWIGQVASYESPGSYVGINEGDPVPLGEPDLVHSAGYPFLTPGGTYCEPPAPARFTLSIGGG